MKWPLIFLNKIKFLRLIGLDIRPILSPLTQMPSKGVHIIRAIDIPEALCVEIATPRLASAYLARKVAAGA